MGVGVLPSLCIGRRELSHLGKCKKSFLQFLKVETALNKASTVAIITQDCREVILALKRRSQ